MKRTTAPAEAGTDLHYVLVWAALIALTVLTVLVARVNLGEMNVVVAVAIASLKAGLVLYFFMHLRHERWIFQVMLLVTLVTLGIILSMTFADIGFRYGHH